MEQSSVKQSTFERCKRSQCTFRLLQRNSTLWGNSILWALMSTTQHTAILDLKEGEQGGGGGCSLLCIYMAWHENFADSKKCSYTTDPLLIFQVCCTTLYICPIKGDPWHRSSEDRGGIRHASCWLWQTA